MRRPFDTKTGKHVAKGAGASTEQIFEPLPHVVAALEIKCPECSAQPGEKCASIIDASKYFDTPHAGRVQAARPRFSPIVKAIGTCAFCDNGAVIQPEDIAAALNADRGAGFRDPTAEEVELLVQGGDDGEPPPELRAAHPALDALLTREMA